MEKYIKLLKFEEKPDYKYLTNCLVKMAKEN
jgi:hypothetical protein